MHAKVTLEEVDVDVDEDKDVDTHQDPIVLVLEDKVTELSLLTGAPIFG